jgi:hypothetical protein
MDFVTLYGTELDRELGTADRTQRFTTARRKAAINAAQLEWNKRTECVTRLASVSLVDDTQEYDLETITDFAQISRRGVSIRIVSGSSTRYLEGKSFTSTSVERLNIDEPNWRAVAAAIPAKYYTRRDGGAFFLGLHPKPHITGSDTWTALVDYVIVPADMSADSDEPFTISGNALKTQRPWHRALVYYAAFDLEKLRKDTAREQAMFQLFEAEVTRYLGAEKPKSGDQVQFAQNYRRKLNVPVRRFDPRSTP